MALKTLDQLVEDVRRLIDDQAVSADWIKGWINQGLADLAPVLRLEGMAAVNVEAERDEYAAPQDLLEIRLLKLEGAIKRPLPFYDFENAGFRLWNNTIILQPAPEKDGTMEIWYWRVPAEVTEVPMAFQHLLILYAACCYLAEQRDVEVEQVSFWPKYMLGKRELAKYVAQRHIQNMPRHLRVVR